jgi:glycosyltransferase involved in cell wall biosynthesis
MQEDSLKVGAIVANYNGAKFIIDCLNALINQTYKPSYIVVVDDGSTDDSWPTILDSVQRINDIKPLSKAQSHHSVVSNNIEYCLLQLQKNQGPSFARNVGLQWLLDKCHVIAIADSDDIYYPRKIEKSIQIIKEYPQVGLVYTDYDVNNMATNELKREFKEPFSYRRLFEECIVSNNSIYPIMSIKTVGGYDDSIRYGEDYDLWLRISEVAAVHHIPEALYQYRLTGQNITTTISSEKFGQHVSRVKQKAYDRRMRNHDSNSVRS